MQPVSPQILNRIAHWPEAAQTRLIEIRAIFFQAADDVGCELGESLKWNEPSWRPGKGGTTLRVSWFEDRPDEIGIFVHCQTNLSETMREIYPDAFRFSGNRGLHMALQDDLPHKALQHLAALAFTYHRGRKSAAAGA